MTTQSNQVPEIKKLTTKIEHILAPSYHDSSTHQNIRPHEITIVDIPSVASLIAESVISLLSQSNKRAEIEGKIEAFNKSKSIIFKNPTRTRELFLIDKEISELNQLKEKE